MRTAISKIELQLQMKGLLEQQGTVVKERTIEAFIKIIEQVSHWFITRGGLKVPNWVEVSRDLQKKQLGSPDSFPTVTFSLQWLVKDALSVHRVKVKREIEAAKEVLQEIQEEETHCSLCSTEDWQEERRACRGGNGKNVGRG